MIRLVLLAGLLLAGVARADGLEQLQLLAEHPVEGVPRGNLSGLAWCDGGFWTVSDRDDDRLYRLIPGTDRWTVEAERFNAPEPPPSGLPWGLRQSQRMIGWVRGGMLDFEGITCDGSGNRYLLSEAHLGILRIPPVGPPEWLKLPAALVRQARGAGLLQRHNAFFEGIAVDAAGQRLWLAAERERRGLLVLHRNQNDWQCNGGCLLFSEGGLQAPPPQSGLTRPQPLDFSDLMFYRDRLYTLERMAHQICRRSLSTGEAERCWSFADAALAEPRRYQPALGAAEGLWLDASGAWILVDNDGQPRGDGERRPVLWQFAVPAQGWESSP